MGNGRAIDALAYEYDPCLDSGLLHEGTESEKRSYMAQRRPWPIIQTKS